MTQAEIEAVVRRCEELRQRGEWSVALECYLDLLEKMIAAGLITHVALLLVIERTADLAALFGHCEAADGLLTELAQLCCQHDNDYYTDYALLKRIRLAAIRSDVRGVAELFNALASRIGDIYEIEYTPEGLKRWEKSLHWRKADREGRTVMLALLCLEIGSLWLSLGQYGQALLLFERGLAYTAGTVVDLARQTRISLQLGLASAQLEKGELTRARATLEALAPQLNPALHPGFITRRLEMLGKLELLQGELGRALNYFSQALQLCIELQAHRAALTAVLNLAHVRLLLNQTLIAKLSLEVVRDEALRLGEPTAAARAEFLWQLAEARNQTLADDELVVQSVAEMQQGKPAKASANDLPPRQIDPFDLPQADSFLAFFEDQTIAFHHLLGFRDLPAAANYLDRLEDLFIGSDSELIRLRLSVLRGMTSYYQGRYHPQLPAAKFREAEMTLAEACAQLEAKGLKLELWQARRILTWCRAWLNPDDLTIPQLLNGADDLLSQIANTLPPWERALYMSNKWTADEEVIAFKLEELLALQRELEQRFWLFSLRQRWSLLERLHELMLHLDRYKDALSRKTIAGQAEPQLTPTPAFSLWQRLWRHPRRRVTLSFLVLPDRVLAIRSGFLSLRFSARELARNRLRELVQSWHLNISAEATRQLLISLQRRKVARDLGGLAGYVEQQPTRDIEAIARELADALSLPALLKDLPQRINALTIVPDDSLHGFPFAALRYQEKYLIERFALSLTFESTPRTPALAAPSAGEALLVAVPDGAKDVEIDGVIYDIDPLPDTVLELDRIAPQFRNGPGSPINRLVGNCATKETVLQRLPSASFFHIACHGLSNAERPDQSCLLLIPEPSRVEPLTLRDLSELTLDHLQHITLSSCWAADNFVLPGRWVISLPETLWRAGAHSILGSLWWVRDDIAVAFMESFYQNLAHSPRDQALRQTQLACFKGELLPNNAEVTQPANWAGYNLYGDYRALRFDGGKSRKSLRRYFIE
jgi:CHAT domain-containing protein